MIKRIVCVLALLFAGLVVSAPRATAEQTLSEGCAVANLASLDGLYVSASPGGFYQNADWFAGEIVHITAGPPDVAQSGEKESIEFVVDDVVVATTPYPGSLDYTFPTTGSFRVEWRIAPLFSGSATWTASCENTPPECTAVGSSLTSIKADGKLQRVTLSGATDPFGEVVSLAVTGVTQDEPTTGGWRNDLKTPDAGGVSGESASVRGERNPTLNGRVYRIHYIVTDSSGATCSGYATVGVDVKKGRTAVDDGSQASWNSFTGALL